MIKRISCRVVSSIPLGRAADALRRPISSSSNDRPDRIDDFVAEDIQVKHAGKSVRCMGWLNIARASIDDTLAGYILDCYA
jgi:hypothetical protein